MLVFDIVVNGEVKETIRPNSPRLKEMYHYVAEQVRIMKKRYGRNIRVERRMLY